MMSPNRLPTRLMAGLALAGATASFSPSLCAQNSAVLEEVIVTARKTLESMQDVPVAVTAFSGDNIDSLVMRDPPPLVLP